MKNTVIVFAALLSLSLSVFASDTDRQKLGEANGRPIFGILHTENFELKCDVTSGEGPTRFS